MKKKEMKGSKKSESNKQKIILYQTAQGKIEFKGDLEKETLWASQLQIADLFSVDRSVITRHINNIFSDKELDRKVVCAKFAQTTSHGALKGKTQTRDVYFYNLDLIISVGYRVNSQTATKFRQWATKTLREHLVKGYTIDRKRIGKNYEEFLQAVESVQKLLPSNKQVEVNDTLELIKMFASTWFSLNAYDKSILPKSGFNKRQVKVTAEELNQEIIKLKQDLIEKKEASELFAIEKEKDAVAGIVGNVLQSISHEDVYQTLEEKAAHLLYFFIKNHPFVDGNKRSGAFAFVWFLNKAKILQKSKISPETLTALTLLVAESDPKEKDQMIGLILQLLKKQ